MASILKVDQLQSDSGTVTVASNLSFSGTSTFVGNIANPIITGTMNLSGGQIKFPATQVPSADANTLDDYEEGTWTATLLNGGNIASVQPLKYTKIGRVVHIDGFVGWDSLPNNSSIFEIHGLPFTTSNTYISGSIGYVGAATTTGWFLIGQSSANYLYFHVGTGGDSSRKTNANVISANFATIIFSITYTTT
jgi:hypothetical protein